VNRRKFTRILATGGGSAGLWQAGMQAADAPAQARYRGETRITGELYEAGAGNLIPFLATLADETTPVLLIAHNPGLEELLESLVGVYTPLTTAALAQIELSVRRWQDLDEKTRGRLIKIWQPRELES
jgi:phosphohistidine phosphatase SixA